MGYGENAACEGNSSALAGSSKTLGPVGSCTLAAGLGSLVLHSQVQWGGGAADRGGSRSHLRAVGVRSSTAVVQGLRERLTELMLVNVYELINVLTLHRGSSSLATWVLIKTCL